VVDDEIQKSSANARVVEGTGDGEEKFQFLLLAGLFVGFDKNLYHRGSQGGSLRNTG
jgi:hypothetical protein